MKIDMGEDTTIPKNVDLIEWPPRESIRARVRLHNDLNALKAKLLRQYMRLADDVEQAVAFTRAATEAAALAWFTPAPLLMFPTLFEEKVLEKISQLERQRHIREQSKKIISFAE